MGYTPENEKIEDAIEAIFEGLSFANIRELRNVVEAREEAGYKAEHIKEMYSILEALRDVRRRLSQVN